MKTLAAVLAVILLVAPASAQAAERSALSTFGHGAAAATVSVFWGPAKVLFAAGGAAIAGLAWVITGGHKGTARRILQSAVRGDYVVTPAQIAMEAPLSFVGRDPDRDPYPYKK
ncbi:MAG: hypothetical protein HRU00_18045 [Myxococcales bacterium]|nr:hypothetical protein [Myxococcales bacterium]